MPATAIYTVLLLARASSNVIGGNGSVYEDEKTSFLGPEQLVVDLFNTID